MSGLHPMFDPVETEFRELERLVKQRECEHPHTVEVTTMGDPEPVYLCPNCGHRTTEAP